MANKHFIDTIPLLLLLGAFLLSGCQGQSSKSPFGATGAPSSLMVILPDSLDSPELRDSISGAFARPVFVLPQNEPMQDLMFTPEANFTAMFRSLRNILFVSIDHTVYTRPSVSIVRDHYTTGQLIIHAKAESLESFYTLLRVRGPQLSKYVYNEELKRWGNLLQQTYSSAFAKLVEQNIPGITVNIPAELEYTNVGEDFLWASNMDQRRRMDFVLYSFPYQDAHTFTLDYLIHKRDSVMAANIHGAYPGSYITTEKKVKPSFRGFTYKGGYRAEIRGLWAMVNDMMGGPFVMHAVLDGTQTRVIVAEALVYAPSEKKRNLMLYNESALYTLRPAGSDFVTHTFAEDDEEE